MSRIKDIYITHEKGLELLAPYVQEAVEDLMGAFPAHKNDYPIKNLGNWQSAQARTCRNGSVILNPYESIDWYIERAKLRASAEGRWESRRQISIDQLYYDLEQDKYARQIPQLSLLITSKDLYGTAPDGRLLNFCLGVSKEDAFSIISVRRFLDENNRLDIEGFKTVVMHEFGHVLGLTGNGRVNSHECLGAHCLNDGCIMQQRLDGDFREITRVRLARKMRGQPPICSDCIREGNRYFQNQMIKFYQSRGAISTAAADLSAAKGFQPQFQFLFIGNCGIGRTGRRQNLIIDIFQNIRRKPFQKPESLLAVKQQPLHLRILFQQSGKIIRNRVFDGAVQASDAMTELHAVPQTDMIVRQAGLFFFIRSKAPAAAKCF